MKKLLLFLASGAVMTGVNAQESRSFMQNPDNGKSHLQVPFKVSPDFYEQLNAKQAAAAQGARKGTAGGSRAYSYYEAKSQINSNIQSNLRLVHIWNRPDIIGVYTNAVDTVGWSSYGSIFHPQGAFYNDPIEFPNEIAVRNQDAYTIDSITLVGSYFRNASRPTSVVDTLRMSFTYGNGTEGNNNVSVFSIFSTTPGEQIAGYDTIRAAMLHYDHDKNTAAPGSGSAVPVTFKDILLTEEDTAQRSNDQGSIAPHTYTIVPDQPLNIPAGNMFGFTASFISGDTYTPFEDTLFDFVKTPVVDSPYFNAFLPWFFFESETDFPEYIVNDYNNGLLKRLPIRNNSWDDVYYPNWAWAKEFTYEIPLVTFHVSCATCLSVDEASSVTRTEMLIKDIKAYPNPATDRLFVPVVLGADAKNVNVQIISSVGQVISSVNLGNGVAGQQLTADFSTSSLSSGVYLYSVEVDGQRQTGRFSVSK